MQRAALALLALALTPPALADECDTVGPGIASKVGATVIRRIGPAFKLAHSEASTLQVDCRDGRALNVAGSHDTPGSIAPFAQTVAKMASLAYGVTTDDAAGAMLQCVRRASAKAGTIADTSANGLKVSCYVLRDYVTLDIKRQ